MDPFSALSLAASVVQFLEFGVKLISESSEIYKSTRGLSIEHAELEDACLNLGTLSSDLAEASAESTFNTVQRSQKEEGLRRMAVACSKIADELLAALRKMSLHDGRHGKLTSFRQALKNVWGKGKVKSLEARLNKYKQHLSLHLAVISSDNQSSILRALHELKEKNSLLEYAHSNKLDNISNVLREISGKPLDKPVPKEASKTELPLGLGGLESLDDTIRLKIEAQESEQGNYNQKLPSRLTLPAGRDGHDSRPEMPFFPHGSEENDEEVILSWEEQSDPDDEIGSSNPVLNCGSHGSRRNATIGTWNGSSARTVMPAGVDPKYQPWTGDKNSKSIPLAAQKTNSKLLTRTKPDLQGFTMLADKLPLLISMANQIAAEQIILSSLHFRTMTVRHENIADAHVNTFNWVFRSSNKKVSNRRHNVYFLDWLEAQNGTYWVSGKPGSGKSTLMKFLCDNARTKEAIALWASPKKCFICSHFFWSVGTPMQKSQEGLLRSLLYDVFKKCPMIVEEVCPDRWGAAQQGHKDNEPWTLPELRKTMTRLAACKNLGAKFCFFIDGLDEYDGDHLEVIRILDILSTSQHIKLCLSSRPWNIFEDAYGRSTRRKLYLQDLTRNDIRSYVKAKLQEHPNWDPLLSSDIRFKDIVKQVTKKAEGVFLWVFLVMRSLQEGLTNGDTLTDMQRRIQTLPADLEQFFKHMLDSVDYFYHDQMVRTFQVAMSSPIPLALMIYSFLDEGLNDEGFALNAPFRQMPDHIINLRHEQMRRRLNGRCKGLLEVYRNPALDPYYLGHQVDFLHRTVRDFLRTKEMSDFLTTKTSACGPNTSILRAYVALVKCVPLQKAHFEDGGTLSKILMDAFHFAQQAEIESSQAQTELLDDLHENLKIFAAASGRRIPWYRKCYTSPWYYNDEIPYCGSFLEFSIQKGLSLYVKEKIRIGIPSLGIATPLLDCALRICQFHTAGEPDLTEVVQVLLDQGLNPNEMIERSTVWAYFLQSYTDEIQSTRDYDGIFALALHRHRLIDLLISRGADPNVMDPDAAEGGNPAWGRLLLAATSKSLSPNAVSILSDTIKLFLRAGADPNFRNGQWGSKSIWKQFLQYIEGLSGSYNTEVTRLEPLSNMTCAMLSHGADPTLISKQTVLNNFGPRFAEHILEALREGSPYKQNWNRNDDKTERGSWSVWSWFYPKSTTSGIFQV